MQRGRSCGYVGNAVGVVQALREQSVIPTASSPMREASAELAATRRRHAEEMSRSLCTGCDAREKALITPPTNRYFSGSDLCLLHAVLRCFQIATCLTKR